MINLLTEAVSIAIHAEFGDGYPIYREEIRQGFEEPCFFISCLNPTKRLVLGNRYFRENLFCIQYFPKEGAGPGGEDHTNEECHAVAERLCWCLECLDAGGAPVRGRRMHYEVSDGILHFFVNYDRYVRREREPVPYMEEVSEKTMVKG